MGDKVYVSVRYVKCNVGDQGEPSTLLGLRFATEIDSDDTSKRTTPMEQLIIEWVRHDILRFPSLSSRSVTELGR